MYGAHGRRVLDRAGNAARDASKEPALSSTKFLHNHIYMYQIMYGPKRVDAPTRQAVRPLNAFAEVNCFLVKLPFSAIISMNLSMNLEECSTVHNMLQSKRLIR